MKINIRITKDVLRRSMMCGVDNISDIVRNCAIAVAVNEIIPYCSVTYNDETEPVIVVYNKLGIRGVEIPLSVEAKDFMIEFDELDGNPELRLDLEERTFEIDIPSEVINEIEIGQVYKILSESKTLELVEI